MWRIVEEKGLSPEVVRNWTRADVVKMNAVLDMVSSYDLAQQGQDDIENPM